MHHVCGRCRVPDAAEYLARACGATPYRPTEADHLSPPDPTGHDGQSHADLHLRRA